MFVNVIVNIPSTKVDKLFEYHIPKDLEPFIQVGERIKIPFGEANRVIHGFIIDIHDEPIFDKEIKEIIEIPDLKPLITEEQLLTAKQIQESCYCPLVRILNLMIPSGLRMQTFKYLVINDSMKLDANLAKILDGKTKVLITKELLKYSAQINKQIKLENAYITYEADDRTHQVYQTNYLLDKSINYPYLDLPRNHELKEKVNTLIPNHQYSKSELTILRFTESEIKRLVQKQIFQTIKEKKSRIKEKNFLIDDYYYKNHIEKIAEDFYDDYCKNISNHKPFLYVPQNDNQIIQGLGGIILDNLKDNKKTIILVPDILSSYKFSDLLRKYLGLEVLCMNSEIPEGEKLDTYFKVVDEEYDVMVTTSVAALWPYKKIGTIVMIDEESDNYLNDQSPRFDLRKVMLERTNHFNSSIVFISSTPSLETFTMAIEGKYNLLDYHLYGNADSVNYLVSNLNTEFKKGNYSPISTDLHQAITANLTKKSPTLLILNNKGTSDFVICRECGNVEKCEKCHISLKYREKDDKLVCPACGKSISFTHQCSACGSNKIKFMGLGIEKLKKHLEETYPKIRIAVIDEPKYRSFKRIIEDIDKGNIDIVISTNVYSRGLSTTKITLVGIISLDLVLKVPGYKSNHLAYSMLNNLNKIINRENEPTKMIIQTYNPNHFVITNFIKNDYYSYYKEEIKRRYMLNASPFYDINRLLVKGKYEVIYKKAFEIRQTIQKLKDTIVIGPTYNYTEKGAQLIIKTKNQEIDQIYKNIYQESEEIAKDYFIIIDKNPKSIV